MKSILRGGTENHILNSGFQVSGSFSLELGFRILIFSGITDSLGCIPDSTSKHFPDSGIRSPLHWATTDS